MIGRSRRGRAVRTGPEPGRGPAATSLPFDAASEEPELIEADNDARQALSERRRREAPSPAIDPRIAARRARVEADSVSVERRRRRWAVGAVVVSLLVCGAALAALSPLASVLDVEVSGAERTGPAAVRAASGLDLRPPLIRIDPDQVRSRVEDLPWVRRATVERRWPRTVVVTVEERQPAAISPCQASAATGCLLDGSGRVLGPADPRATAGLPRLAGVPAAGEPGSTLSEPAQPALAVAVNLPSALRPLVLGVKAERGEVSLELHAPGRDLTPPVVRLGGPDRIQDKLTAAATVLARTSVDAVATLDVRVPESPALTRTGR